MGAVRVERARDTVSAARCHFCKSVSKMETAGLKFSLTAPARRAALRASKACAISALHGRLVAVAACCSQRLLLLLLLLMLVLLAAAVKLLPLLLKLLLTLCRSKTKNKKPRKRKNDQ